MSPFIFSGKLLASKFPLNEEYDIFFFFPSYAIGGAERVNAEIVKSFPDKKVIVFFTKNSPNDGMLHFFKLPNVTIKEINNWTDNKFKYWNNLLYRGICSKYINRQKKTPIVFIGQCNFGYKITPHINRSIKIVELIHMYDPKFNWVWGPFIKFIDVRILLSSLIKEKFKNMHIKYGIPLKYIDRIQIISNCLEYIPDYFVEKEFASPLKIYYAGRGGPQKRVWIIVSIIEKCRELNLPVSFKLAGPFKNELPVSLIEDGTYVGELKGGEEMYSFHMNNDMLLMTSAWEGFPIVIMEAMAFGSIPLVTNVDAVPEYIIENKTGFLLHADFSDEHLVEQAIVKILKILNSPKELKLIAKHNYEVVTKQFTNEIFAKRYRKLFYSDEY